MSDEANKEKDAGLKAFQILVDVNQKVDLLGARIKSAEEGLEKMPSLMSDLRLLKQAIDDLSRKLDLRLVEQDSRLHHASSFQDDLSKKLEKLYALMAHFDASFSEMKNAQASSDKGHQDGLNRLGERLQELKMNCASSSDLERHSQENENKLEDLRQDRKDMKKKLLSHETKLVSIFDVVNNQDSKHEKLSKSQSDLYALVGKNASNFMQKNEDLYAHVDMRHKLLVEIIEAQISKVREDMGKLPSSAQAVQEEIKKVVESIALDASNAARKATYCDHAVKAMERKIESLFLQVKNLGG